MKRVGRTGTVAGKSEYRKPRKLTQPSSLSVPSLHRSRLPILVILLGLVLSPLITFGALQPSPSAAQGAPNADVSESIYDSSIGPVFTLPQWTDGGGWDGAEYYSTIQLADINGDGADEMLARGFDGLIVESWDETLGLWQTTATGGPFSNDGGWELPQYYETIQTADIDGDGSAELLGRSSEGIETYKWDGTKWNLLLANMPKLSDLNGWELPQYYETIQTADIDGDGAAELLARSPLGIDTYRWENSTWTTIRASSPDWSDTGGWNKAEYYSTIQTADIDGDSADELLARGLAGMFTYKWGGSNWQLLKASTPAWSDLNLWNQAGFYSTIQTGDVNGDGAAELIGRDYYGIDVYSWTGGGWKSLAKNDPDWGNPNGWNLPEYYATIQTGDIDGDGAAELLGRDDGGIETLKWDSGTWVQLANPNPKLSDAHWNSVKNYSTIQTGDIDGDKSVDLIGRGLYGIRTWSYNEVTANAWDHPVAYGFDDFTGAEADAYSYVNDFLTIAAGQTVREQYTTDANTLGNYQRCLQPEGDDNEWKDWAAPPVQTCESLGAPLPITPPAGLTLAAWNTVAEQIYNELGLARSVSDYYSDLITLYTGIYSDDRNILDSTATLLYGDDMSEVKVDAFFEDLFLAPFELAELGGPIASAVGGTLSALIGAGLTTAGGDSFEGKWSEAQTRFTELTEKNKNAINDSRSFVAGDASLLTYVADQKTSGKWDPSDAWVTRSMTSEGRKNFALWIYQTLSPSVWEINVYYSYLDINCGSPGDEIYYYFVNDNKHHDCYRIIDDQGAFGGPAPAKQLNNIFDPVSTSCIPTETNDATWEYGVCNLGVAKEDFFLNRNGWDFDTYITCTLGFTNPCPPPPAGIDISPGDTGNTIDLNHQGSVSVAILGTADYDAQSTIIGSLEFAGAAPVGWWTDLDHWDSSRVKDVNGDGYLDVVATFAISDLQLTADDTTAVLRGASNTTRFILEAPVTVLPER